MDAIGRMDLCDDDLAAIARGRRTAIALSLAGSAASACATLLTLKGRETRAGPRALLCAAGAVAGLVLGGAWGVQGALRTLAGLETPLGRALRAEGERVRVKRQAEAIGSPDVAAGDPQIQDTIARLRGAYNSRGAL